MNMSMAKKAEWETVYHQVKTPKKVSKGEKWYNAVHYKMVEKMRTKKRYGCLRENMMW